MKEEKPRGTAGRRVSVGVVQTRPRFGRTLGNLDRALLLMARSRADVFVLPELAFSGYNFSSQAQVRSLAHSARDAAVFPAMAAFCRRRGSFACYGFPERAGGRLFNSAALVGPRGLVGVYRKTHLFGREKLFFSPGDTGFRAWNLPFGRVGVMICFDWYFPESARTLALRGADMILHPSNLVLPHCPEALKVRALENRVFIAMADRVGTERGLTFIGESEIVSPRGEIMTRLGRGEGVAAARVDLSPARDKRVTSRNDLFKDRRPEMYS